MLQTVVHSRSSSPSPPDRLPAGLFRNAHPRRLTDAACSGWDPRLHGEPGGLPSSLIQHGSCWWLLPHPHSPFRTLHQSDAPTYVKGQLLPVATAASSEQDRDEPLEGYPLHLVTVVDGERISRSHTPSDSALVECTADTLRWNIRNVSISFVRNTQSSGRSCFLSSNQSLRWPS